MLSQLTTLLVMVSLLFGGAGATVYAAQDSLPNDALYPVKTVSEDVGLSLAVGQQAKLTKVLALQNRRMGEIVDLIGQGEQVSQQVQSRLQTQLDYALQLAAKMDGEQMRQALEQIRANNQVLAQTMTKLRANKPEGPASTMSQLQVMVRSQNRLVEFGLEEPLQFQHILRTQNRLQWNKVVEEEQGDETPLPEDPSELTGETVPDSQQKGNCETCEPAMDGTGPGYGPGPNNQGVEQQPEDGYGPGICETCEPVLDGTGPGPGPNYQGGEQNTNGGYGPGTCDTCDPALDGTGPGPGPENKGQTSGQPEDAQGPKYNGSGPGNGPAIPNQGEMTQPEESYGPGPGPQGEVEPPAAPAPDQGKGGK